MDQLLSGHTPAFVDVELGEEIDEAEVLGAGVLDEGFQRVSTRQIQVLQHVPGRVLDGQ